MAITTLNEISQARPVPNVATGMETVAGFESMQRIARLFATSSIVPKAYQGNMPNCFVAVDMAMRMNANPLMVMQNLYIVHGTPAWSAQFLIATFNCVVCPFVMGTSPAQMANRKRRMERWPGIWRTFEKVVKKWFVKTGIKGGLRLNQHVTDPDHFWKIYLRGGKEE